MKRAALSHFFFAWYRLLRRRACGLRQICLTLSVLLTISRILDALARLWTDIYSA